MSTSTIRLPHRTAQSPKSPVRSRGRSVDKRIEAWSAQALAACDAEPRLRSLAGTADVAQALRMLERVDAAGLPARPVIEAPKR